MSDPTTGPARNVIDEHADPARRPTPALGDTRRIITQWVLTLVVLAVLLAVYLNTVGLGSGGNYQWDFNVLAQYLPALGRGVLLTVELAGVSLVLSVLLGFGVSAARMSSWVPLRWLVTLYIEVMRSTPLLIQLVWIFYALPILTGIQLPGYQAGVVALTLHMGAYYGEAFRAGVQSVPKQHLETAQVLGLRWFDRARFVVLPQAIRNVLPVLVTNALLLLKDTSLVSVLGINDLMNAGTTVALATYRPLEVLTTVGLFYLIIGFPFTLLVRRAEIRLQRRTA